MMSVKPLSLLEKAEVLSLEIHQSFKSTHNVWDQTKRVQPSLEDLDGSIRELGFDRMRELVCIVAERSRAHLACSRAQAFLLAQLVEAKGSDDEIKVLGSIEARDAAVYTFGFGDSSEACAAAAIKAAKIASVLRVIVCGGDANHTFLVLDPSEENLAEDARKTHIRLALKKNFSTKIFLNCLSPQAIVLDPLLNVAFLAKQQSEEARSFLRCIDRWRLHQVQEGAVLRQNSKLRDLIERCADTISALAKEEIKKTGYDPNSSYFKLLGKFSEATIPILIERFPQATDWRAKIKGTDLIFFCKGPQEKIKEVSELLQFFSISHEMGQEKSSSYFAIILKNPTFSQLQRLAQDSPFLARAEELCREIHSTIQDPLPAHHDSSEIWKTHERLGSKLAQTITFYEAMAQRERVSQAWKTFRSRLPRGNIILDEATGLAAAHLGICGSNELCSSALIGALAFCDVMHIGLKSGAMTHDFLLLDLSKKRAEKILSEAPLLKQLFSQLPPNAIVMDPFLRICCLARKIRGTQFLDFVHKNKLELATIHIVEKDSKTGRQIEELAQKTCEGIRPQIEAMPYPPESPYFTLIREYAEASVTSPEEGLEPALPGTKWTWEMQGNSFILFTECTPEKALEVETFLTTRHPSIPFVSDNSRITITDPLFFMKDRAANSLDKNSQDER